MPPKKFQVAKDATPARLKEFRQTVGHVNCLIWSEKDIEQEAFIGAGAYGEISRVRHVSRPNKSVVAKKLKIIEDDRECMRILAKEMRILSNLRHMNIVSIIAYCDKPLTLFMEMIYFDWKDYNLGERSHNLQDLLRTIDDYSMAESFMTEYESFFMDIACDVAEGLAYLHMQTVVHRDLKPENVLVSNQMGVIRQNSDVLCKLTDFGEARSRSIQTSTVLATRTTKAERGTYPFMAPEILAAERPQFTPTDLGKVDIWALGMVFYCLLNPDRRMPFIREDESGDIRGIVIKRMKSQDLPEMSGGYSCLREKYPSILKAMEQCLQYQSSKRPNAVDLSLDLCGGPEGREARMDNSSGCDSALYFKSLLSSRISDNIEILVSHLCTESVIAIMVPKHLSGGEMHHLNGAPDWEGTGKATCLLTIIMNSLSEDKKVAFVEALRKSHQSHLAKLIDPRENDAELLSAEEKQNITKVWENLSESLEPEKLCPYLVHDNVITRPQSELVSQCTSCVDRCKALLQILLTRSSGILPALANGLDRVGFPNQLEALAPQGTSVDSKTCLPHTLTGPHAIKHTSAPVNIAEAKTVNIREHIQSQNVQVLVNGIHPGTPTEMVDLFLSNPEKCGGGPIQNLQYEPGDVAALVTYQDVGVARKVVSKMDSKTLNGRQLEYSIAKPTRVVEIKGLGPGITTEMLELYFENPDRSGGGDIDKIILAGGERAHITFERQDVAEAVANRQVFNAYECEMVASLVTEYNLLNSANKEIVRIPEQKESFAVEVTGFQKCKSNVSEECIQMLFENKLGQHKIDFVQYHKETLTAVIKLKHSDDVDRLIKITTDKPLKLFEAMLHIEPLDGNVEICSSAIEVSNIPKGIKKQEFYQFFQDRMVSCGGRIENIFIEHDQDQAILTFTDNSAVQSIIQNQTRRPFEMGGNKVLVRIIPPARPLPAISGRIDKEKALILGLPENVCPQALLQFLQRHSDTNVDQLTFGLESGKVLVSFQDILGPKSGSFTLPPSGWNCKSTQSQVRDSSPTSHAPELMTFTRPDLPAAVPSPTHAPAPSQPLPPGAYFILDDQTLKTEEGIQVSLRKGSIVNTQVDVIVSTGSQDIVGGFNSGGVAGAIYKKAGSGILNECKSKEAIKPGGLEVSNGYSLPCKIVYHTYVRSWKNDPRVSEQDIRSVLRECMQQAHSNGYTSIVFPVIGAGNNKVPKEHCARIMYNEVALISKQMPGCLVQDVRFVIYEKDIANLQAFEAEILNVGHHSIEGPSPIARFGDSAFASGSSMAAEALPGETSFGPIDLSTVSVVIETGNITDQTTDAIINSTNTTLNLNKGALSRSLRNAGGPAFVNECRRKASELQDGGVVITGGGNMAARYVVHLVAPTVGENLEKEWKSVIFLALKEAEKAKITSITCPALGTGTRGLSTDSMATIVLQVIQKFDEGRPKNLKKLQILLFDHQSLPIFKTKLAEIANKPGIFSRFMNIFPWSSSRASGKAVPPSTDTRGAYAYAPSPGGSHHIRPLPFDEGAGCSGVLSICGKDQSMIDFVINKVNVDCETQITTDRLQSEIVSEVLPNLGQESIKEIESLGIGNQVSIKISSNKDCITVSGLKDEVKELKTEITSFLAKELTRIQDNERECLINKVVRWCFIPPGQNAPVEYPAHINAMLEKAFSKGTPQVEAKDHSGRIITFILKDPMSEQPNGARIIRKMKDGISLPHYWKNVDYNKQRFYGIDLDPNSPEYQDIAASVGNFQIKKITRIQNRTLYEGYIAQKKGIESKNPGKNCEKLLWHGTRFETVVKINSNNFDRGYSGQNATVFGKGVYFALNFSYSARNTYSVPDTDGWKYVYRSRVLTGSYTQGSQDLLGAPIKDATTGATYDSVVDKVNGPGVFVIFHDNQAYPEYLVIFK